MTSTEAAPARTVGWRELVSALPGLVPDAVTMIKGALRLVSLRRNSRESVGHVFQRLAARNPHRPFLRFDGQEWTYGAANAQVNRYAAALAGYGVGPGSVVGVLATNRPETLLVTLAVVKLGGIAGMLNHRQRGEVLDHSQQLLDSTVLVVGAECREALESLPGTEIRGSVVGLANSGGLLDGYPDLTAAASTASSSNPAQCAQIRAGSKAFYIFTSGTTGLPKASTMSHLRWLKAMAAFGHLGVRLRSSDALYCCLPLYHNNAITVSLSSVLAAGATLALGASFSASRFWDDLSRNRATAFCYIGDLCSYLLNQPERGGDRVHQVRVMVGNGLHPEMWSAFKNRFGIRRVAEFYAASECNLVFINALNLDGTVGTCPLPFAVVDHDPSTVQPVRDGAGKVRRVSTGETGLLLTKVTRTAPFDGYTDPSESEKKLIRNAFTGDDTWFNTGDLVRKQGWRHVQFADRLGDTYRWKGENVAAAEVEAVLNHFGDIEQAVVYGVTVPGAAGKAGMAAIRLRPGAELDGKALAEHVVERLPHYAVPLFIRIVDEFPRTSTFKVRKTELSDESYDTARTSDPVHVLADPSAGYVPFYPTYPDEVAAGEVRV